MKTKRQHIKSLRDIQKCIINHLLRITKEGHIPAWLLRKWGSDVKAVANFMQREIKKGVKKGKVK